MSSTVVRKPAEPALPFEQALFERSPAGTFTTAAAVFVLMFGSFVAIALASHIRIVAGTINEITSSAAWPALVLSLLCCTALAMQRYARLWELRDAPAYGRVLSGGMQSAADVTSLVPPNLKLWPATLAGIAVGLVLSVVIRATEIGEGHQMPPGALLWFSAATTFLSVLFARGVALTRAGSAGQTRTLNTELKIDLLRIDTLAVIGRSAARVSLIWFVISAVACLFFVGGDLDWLTIVLIAGCVVMGVAVFVTIMGRIHSKILATKTIELEHVRSQIEAARSGMHEDSHAAARMHGLIAYEKRIQDAPEWPFDQSTLVRLGAYLLIPIVPWVGQAVVQYFVNRLSD